MHCRDGFPSAKALGAGCFFRSTTPGFRCFGPALCCVPCADAVEYLFRRPSLYCFAVGGEATDYAVPNSFTALPSVASYA